MTATPTLRQRPAADSPASGSTTTRSAGGPQSAAADPITAQASHHLEDTVSALRSLSAATAKGSPIGASKDRLAAALLSAQRALEVLQAPRPRLPVPRAGSTPGVSAVADVADAAPAADARGAGGHVPVLTDLTQAMHQAASELSTLARIEGVHVVVAPVSGSLAVPPSHVGLILGGLLRAAIAQAGRGSRVRLSARRQGGAHGVEFALTHHGEPMSQRQAAAVRRLFAHPLRFADQPWNELPDHLILITDLVRRHGGQLFLECTDDGATRYRLQLPAMIAA